MAGDRFPGSLGQQGARRPGAWQGNDPMPDRDGSPGAPTQFRGSHYNEAAAAAAAARGEAIRRSSRDRPRSTGLGR